MGPEFAVGRAPDSVPPPHPEFECELTEGESVHGVFSDYLALMDQCLGNDRVVDDLRDEVADALADASIEDRCIVGQLMLQHGLTHEVPFEVTEFSKDVDPMSDLVDPLDEDAAASYDAMVVSELVPDVEVDYTLPESVGEERAGQTVRRQLMRHGNFRNVREFEPSHFDVPPQRWDAGVDVDHPTRGVEALERFADLLLESQEARGELDDMIRHSFYPVDLSSFTAAERECFDRVFTEQLVMPVDHVALFCAAEPDGLMPAVGRPTRFVEPNQRVVREVSGNRTRWHEASGTWMTTEGKDRLVERARVLPAPLQLFSSSEDPGCPDGCVRVRRMVTPYAVLFGDELRLYGRGAGVAYSALVGDPWVEGGRHRGSPCVIEKALRALDVFAADLERDYSQVEWELSDRCDHSVGERRESVAPRPVPAERLAELDRARERRELEDASMRWRDYIASREELGWEFVGVDRDGQPRFLRPVAAEVTLREKRFWMNDDWREWDAAFGPKREPVTYDELALRDADPNVSLPPIEGAPPRPRKWNTSHRHQPIRHSLLRNDGFSFKRVNDGVEE